MSESAFDHAYEWYTSGPRQRLQPGGAIIIVMTRWGKKDLTGRLIGRDRAGCHGGSVGSGGISCNSTVRCNPLWPEFWEKDALLGIKASCLCKMECAVATDADYVSNLP